MKFRDASQLPSGDKSMYIRLKDRESVIGVLAGDLHEFAQIWKDGKSTDVPEGTAGASFRFRVNMLVKEGSSYVAKVFEQGVTVYKTLSEIAADWPIESTVIKITRSGSSISDTSYSITPQKQELTPETLAHLKTIKLHDLSGKKPDGSQGDWPSADDEIPF